jgi:deoxyribonuclease V
MKALELHPWKVTPSEARAIQLRLRDQLELRDRMGEIRYVAGADLAFRLPEARSWERGTGMAIAGVIVFRYPEMEEVERIFVEETLTFPYVPGLLSFREIPALIAAFNRLRTAPDLIFVDGHGYAHPRRFGIASHLGVLLDTPTIGCAKSVLIGEYRAPGKKVGSWTPLIASDGEANPERVGAVLRTREGVKPIFVSTGHRVSLVRAIKLVMSVCDGYRIPKPTREADHFVGAAKRGEVKI